MLLGGSVMLAATSASALNIALSNDDGFDSIGIRAMAQALINDGHTVTLAGPGTGQSGSSAGVNIPDVTIKREFDAPVIDIEGLLKVFSVFADVGLSEGAEPASSALIAMDIAKANGPVDLLISGINDEANVGTFAQVSGTVGAAIVALSSSFNVSVPAIAFSANEIDLDCLDEDGNCHAEEEAANLGFFAEIAEFAADFVAHLETKPGFLAEEEGLLPPRVGLNINYPQNPIGVKLSVQGQTARFVIGDKPVNIQVACDGCDGLVVDKTSSGGIRTFPVDEAGDVKNSDAANFDAGYITIVPITGDVTAKSPLKYKSVVNSFE